MRKTLKNPLVKEHSYGKWWFNPGFIMGSIFNIGKPINSLWNIMGYNNII
jgi:hypothetical protein